MKILFIIGDLRENSVDRQLAEIIQQLLKGEAETDILETLEMTECASNSLRASDAIWFIIHEQDCGCPSNLLEFIEATAICLKYKPCTLSSIGGEDGGEQALKELYEIAINHNLRVMDSEVTCVPLKTNRFECSNEYKMNLFWQKESFLKFCQPRKGSADRARAIYTVAGNYFTLIKYVAKDREKPLRVSIDYPDVVTDIGTFDVVDVPEDLKELHYEIDALTGDYNIESAEIEREIINLIDKKW